MGRDLYVAASGGIARLLQLDVAANNIANINTVGYKAQRLLTEEQKFSDTLTSKITDSLPRAQNDFVQSPGTVVVGTKTDFSAGPVEQTGNPLDVAITDDNAFFVVQPPNGQGEEFVTRAGNFTLNATRQLVTEDGYLVMGTGGAIVLPEQGEITISPTGNIVVDAQQVGQLRVVRPENMEGLVREAGTRFKLVDQEREPAVLPNPNLIPKSVEMPNVNVVTAMVDLVTAQRAFEGYQKTVRSIDELNEAALRTARPN